jgi:hypothetical protein
MSWRQLDTEAAVFFRDQLRNARAVALRDAEGFHETAFCLERLGRFLSGQGTGLKSYEPALRDLAKRSPLAEDVPALRREHHIPFADLFELVREGRNLALHEGAFARHLTTHLVELAIVLEDALSMDLTRVAHFMVKNPVCAAEWQPLSMIRQTMLESSFSFLPVFMQHQGRKGWWLIADFALANFLRAAAGKKERSERLGQSLADALQSGAMTLEEPRMCEPNDPISKVLNPPTASPTLVVLPNQQDLVGIIAPFDVL